MIALARRIEDAEDEDWTWNRIQSHTALVSAQAIWLIEDGQ
jgi:hypothetical protein